MGLAFGGIDEAKDLFSVLFRRGVAEQLDPASHFGDEERDLALVEYRVSNSVDEALALPPAPMSDEPSSIAVMGATLVA